MTTANVIFNEGREQVLAMVTAYLNDDRELPGEMVLAMTHTECVRALLVAVDLVGYVHRRWTTSIELDVELMREAWSEMALDILAWQEGLTP